jgi:excisionase family DNA binding protein
MSDSSTALEEALTLADVARVLHVNYQRAAELARLGILPHFRLGRQIRVSRAQLNEFIQNGGQPLPGVWRRDARQ